MNLLLLTLSAAGAFFSGAAAFSIASYDTELTSMTDAGELDLSADLNEDGRPDLLLKEGSRNYVLTNQGEDPFFAGASVSSSSSSAAYTPGRTCDLDGDGVTDYVIAFSRRIYATRYFHSYETGDLNLVAYEYTDSRFDEGSGILSMDCTTGYIAVGTYYSMVIVSFDIDAGLVFESSRSVSRSRLLLYAQLDTSTSEEELVMYEDLYSQYTLTILGGSTAQDFETSISPYAIGSLAVTEDGILIMGTGADGVLLVETDGAGGFDSAGVDLQLLDDVASLGTWIALGDVDNDGDEDIVYGQDESSIYSGSMYWVERLSGGSWAGPEAFYTGGFAGGDNWIAVADVDSNGALDVVVSRAETRDGVGIFWSDETTGVTGASCVENEDCGPMGSGSCDAASFTCTSCFDGERNGDETSIDCGGSWCPGCGASADCVQDSDCGPSFLCTDAGCELCADAADGQPCGCFDGQENGDEGGVDCGGDCSLDCPSDVDTVAISAGVAGAVVVVGLCFFQYRRTTMQRQSSMVKASSQSSQVEMAAAAHRPAPGTAPAPAIRMEAAIPTGAAIPIPTGIAVPIASEIPTGTAIQTPTGTAVPLASDIPEGVPVYG